MSRLVLAVDGDARWVPLALDGDLDAASAASAREVLRLRGHGDPEAEYVDHVTAVLAGLARIARDGAEADADLQTVGAWALMPEEQPTVLGVATLGVTGDDSLDDTVAALVVPDSARRGEPLVESVETPSGSAARITQRVVDERSRVRDSVAYVWRVRPAGHVVLTATFFDPVEAFRWGDAFDDLARLVTARVEP